MGIEKTNKIIPQKRIEIREGMTVDDVKKFGSDGQKLVANLFDFKKVHGDDGILKKDGVYNAKEAEVFNNYNFTVGENVFTMYNRKTGHTTEIKYQNIEELKELLDDQFNYPNMLMQRGKKGERTYVAVHGKNGKTTIDLTNHSVTVDGVTSRQIVASGKEVTVKNSDIKRLVSSGEQLNISNVRDKGFIYDSETDLCIGKEMGLQISNDSKVNIKRDE